MAYMVKILIFIFIITGLSCSKKETTVNNKMESLKQSCYSDRKKDHLLTDVSGKIIFIGEKVHIQTDESTRYLPCDLPVEYVEGTLIKFSGEVMIINPHERWSGTPIQITAISILKP